MDRACERRRENSLPSYGRQLRHRHRFGAGRKRAPDAVGQRRGRFVGVAYADGAAVYLRKSGRVTRGTHKAGPSIVINPTRVSWVEFAPKL